MKQWVPEPLADALGFAAVYIVAVGAIMGANTFILQRMDLPWTWYFVLWAAVFAPAALATILVRATITHGQRRVRVLYAVALLVIVVALEILFVADARATTALVTVGIVSISIVILFRIGES